MIVWLWDAGDQRGVSQHKAKAIAAASQCLREHTANQARVEQARPALEADLQTVFVRTGDGLVGFRGPDGSPVWKPLAALAGLPS